ncbi:TRAP transporter large permease [Algihabitans albus]|uniref:TRAP transporter large permease n=1 Tax=Algihabitans albus TaxID=2164067 RepID=UPI000E5D4C50|nr:TRAP transporter large permease subunit [Algihabitans albus]
MTTVLLIVFPVLLLLAVPVAHALLLAGASAIVWSGRLPLEIVIERIYAPTQSFPMLAIPFFILAGNLMMAGRFGQHLVDFAKLLVGRLQGGLAQVSVVGSVVFGGVSGSAVADATALGNALIPVQKRAGYPAAFCAAVNASSSTISVLIPPSIPLILFGLVSSTSIIDLFIAGILPALILASGLASICVLSGWLRRLPRAPFDGGFRAFRRQAVYALPAILMPVFVVVTLRFGIATPTEVSVMACTYALIVGRFLYRDLTLQGIARAMIHTSIVTGAVMLVIMASSLIQWQLTLEQIPRLLAQGMVEGLEADWLIVLSMIAVMLVVGTFLDLPAAILLLAPIFMSIAAAIGFDPVQLGIVMVLALSIGLYTPPVGTTLFISATIAGTSIGRTVLELVPFYLIALGVLLLVAYLPSLIVF